LQGEVFCGSVTGYQQVIGVTLGTGLGTAAYSNGAAHSADLWNMSFKEGIAEEYLSTRWFLQRYAAITGNTISGVRELAALAPANNWVNSLFDEFGTNLAAFLNEFIAQTNAQAVVIGGNIAQAIPLFKNSLLEGTDNRAVHIAHSSLGEQAALIGAGSFWHHQNSTVI
jgi:glucokinase